MAEPSRTRDAAAPAAASGSRNWSSSPRLATWAFPPGRSACSTARAARCVARRVLLGVAARAGCALASVARHRCVADAARSTPTRGGRTDGHAQRRRPSAPARTTVLAARSCVVGPCARGLRARGSRVNARQHRGCARAAVRRRIGWPRSTRRAPLRPTSRPRRASRAPAISPPCTAACAARERPGHARPLRARLAARRRRVAARRRGGDRRTLARAPRRAQCACVPPCARRSSSITSAIAPRRRRRSPARGRRRPAAPARAARASPRGSGARNGPSARCTPARCIASGVPARKPQRGHGPSGTDDADGRRRRAHRSRASRPAELRISRNACVVAPRVRRQHPRAVDRSHRHRGAANAEQRRTPAASPRARAAAGAAARHA